MASANNRSNVNRPANASGAALKGSTIIGAVLAMKRFLRHYRKATNVNGIGISSEKDMQQTPADTAVMENDHDAALKGQIEAFQHHRERLLGGDAALHWADTAKQSASAAEVSAAHILEAIREDERDHFFGNKATEAIPAAHTRDMGGQFLTNKGRIEESKLYTIARKLPKGAHLHLHFNAELEPEQLIARAKDLPDNMFVRTTRAILTDEDYDQTELVFNVLPIDTTTVDTFSSQYNPDFRTPGSTPWMRWKDFREAFHKRWHREADQWALGKMQLDEREVYGIEQTTNGIWARFNQATRCFKGLLNYESAYRWYVGAAVDNMLADGVMYAELRPMLLDKSIPSDDGTRKLNHSEQMRIIIDEVKRKQEELRARNEFDKFPFGVKIIYCTPRSIPKKMMQREIDDCISLKLEFPDLICGFDLVGAEDRPNHIGFYRDELLAMQIRCKSLGIEIPFLFHAGESLLDMGGSKDPQNSNLYDALLLNSKRIGHGFSLLKHPNLVEQFRERQICIELCPTSNELLHLCRNVKEHPYPELLAAGIPCTLNSDNPNLFLNSVSHEFYQVMVGSPTMNLHGWRQLAEWSITHSMLSDDEKQAAHVIHRREWERCCEWIVSEYGEHVRALESQ